MLYKARNEIIKFYDDYFLMATEAKNKTENKTSGKGLKILTHKQLLQRLTISNNSESLLNKIRQIVYALYQSKEIPKKSM